MMFAAKLIIAAAAILAITGVDAKNKDKKKKNKDRPKDAVTRHCSANQATFLIDGLSESSFKKTLRELPNTARVTFALGPEEVSKRHFNKLVKYAAKHNHGIVYRFSPDYDGKAFKKTDPKKLAKQAVRVKKLFEEVYGVDLKYIYFPWTKYHSTSQVEAVENEGFTVFSNNMNVNKHLSGGAKSDVDKDLKYLNKKGKGAIIYHTSHNSGLASDISWVIKQLHKKDFEVVSLADCLAGGSEEESGEEGEEVVDADAAAVKQASTDAEGAETANVKAAPGEDEATDGKNSASSVYISTALVAISSLLLLL